MSPTQFHDHQHAMRETNNDIMTPSPLKINKDSHFIKKSSPSSSLSLSSSSSSSTLVNGAVTTAPTRTPPRHPVIIYTHSPKVIHTNPKDFMALVQKLTGLSRPEDDDHGPPKPKPEMGNVEKDGKNNNPDNKNTCNDDNESTSVITDENGSSSVGDGQVNSFYVPQNFDPPNAYFNGVPFYNSNLTDLLCSGSAQPFYNYSDSLLLMPNMRSSMSSSTLESMKELSEF